MMQDLWKEVQSISSLPPSFMTHLNYVTCLNGLSSGIKIRPNFNINKKITITNKLKKKLNLINIIKNSLNREYNEILENKEFAEVCCVWIPVKSYYLIFNIWLVLAYLINTNISIFNKNHTKLLKIIKDFIKDKQILLNKDSFCKFYACEPALKFQSRPGDSLKKDINLKRRINSIVKKLANYKLEEFKRLERIPNFKKKVNQIKKEDYIKKEKINLIEFFYWYRIKANYRDLDFLDQDIKPEEFFKFYKNYFELTTNFFNAFKNLINQISKERVGKTILK